LVFFSANEGKLEILVLKFTFKKIVASRMVGVCCIVDSLLQTLGILSDTSLLFTGSLLDVKPSHQTATSQTPLLRPHTTSPDKVPFFYSEKEYSEIQSGGTGRDEL
jgi:hypothetical protein